ncbi:MAG TPA: tetratricopeptide repeat protein, partial [Candidatus Saccharimonadales bacterium]|nr:tetratricopeptide repeat protein [Candidatus Saccharimonadales bacterium]
EKESVLSIYLTNRKHTQAEPISAESAEGADELYKAGLFDQAAKSYEQLIKKAPKNSQAYAGLGKVYIQQSKFEQAAGVLHQAIRYNPTTPSHYANLGIALLGLKDYPEAAKAFEQALKLRPDNQRYQQLYQLAKKGG